MSRVRAFLRVLAWVVLLASALPVLSLASSPIPTSPSPFHPSITGTSLGNSVISSVLGNASISSYLAPRFGPEFVQTSVSIGPELNISTSHLGSSIPGQVGKGVRELARRAALIRQAASQPICGPSESPTLRSRAGLCTRQVLKYVRQKLIYPIMDAVISPPRTLTVKTNVPATRTWTATNPGPAMAGHRWTRGRKCTYHTGSSRPSTAFPSVHVVGRNIWDATRSFLDPVLSPSLLATKVVLAHSKYAVSRAVSMAQGAYGQLGSLLANADALIKSGLPTLDELRSAADTISRGVRLVASQAYSSAVAMLKNYQRRLAIYFGVGEDFASDRLYALLLASSPLLMVPAILALLDFLVGSTGGLPLPYVELDLGPIAREDTRVLGAHGKSVLELVLAYIRGSNASDNRSVVVSDRLFAGDALRNIICGGPYPRMKVLILSLERFSTLFPQFETRPATLAEPAKPRLLITYHQPSETVDQQIVAEFDSTSEAESAQVLSTLSVGRRKEVWVLVSAYVQALGAFKARSLVDLGRVLIDEAFRRLAHGNPCTRIELPTSTAAFLLGLFVYIDARPKLRLLIEYPQPVALVGEAPNCKSVNVKAEDPASSAKPTSVSQPSLSIGRRKEVLVLVRPYVEMSAPGSRPIPVDLSRALVNNTFRELVYGNPLVALVIRSPLPTFFESLYAQFQTRLAEPAKPQLLIECPRPIELPNEASEREAESTTGPAARSIPRVRPGWQPFRPRMVQQDEATSEWRRQQRDAEIQLLTAAEERRQLAAQQPPEPPAGSSRRRVRTRAGRQVRERQTRMEEERLARLQPSSSPEA